MALLIVAAVLGAFCATFIAAGELVEIIATRGDRFAFARCIVAIVGVVVAAIGLATMRLVVLAPFLTHTGRATVFIFVTTTVPAGCSHQTADLFTTRLHTLLSVVAILHGRATGCATRGVAFGALKKALTVGTMLHVATTVSACAAVLVIG